MKTLFTLLLGTLLSVAHAAPERPNIILVLTDDQGWNHVSAPMMRGRDDSRSHVIQTPNIERLASRGMTFSCGYAPGPMCAVSRFGIMYGRNPARLRRSVNNPKLERPSVLEMKSIAQTLKAIDPRYRTAHIGKWHLKFSGVDENLTPDSAGFDINDGPTSNGEGNTDDPADPKRMFSLTTRAIAFMEKEDAAGNPFFLQLSHYANHSGHRCRPETEEKYSQLKPDDRHMSVVYNAMTEDLDTSIGQLLDAIDALGIGEHTYFFLTSDNGGKLYVNPIMNNNPLQGGKSSIWEGGLRVPTFVAGPNVASGSFCDTPIVGTDLLSTFADLAGDVSGLPSDLDSLSFRKLLENAGEGALERTDPLVFHFPHIWKQFSPRQWSAIRRGDFKLIQYWDGDQETLLFDLKTDLGEANDLTASKPELAQEMAQELLAYLERVNAEKAHESWTLQAALKKEAKKEKARLKKEARKAKKNKP